MVLPIAFALMGKAASDKMRQDEIDAQDREANRAWQNEERAFTRSQRARMQDEQRRQDTTRQAVIDATKPVVPTDGQIGAVGGEDEEGNPLASNPTAGTFKVDGQRFADRASADAAAAKANAPDQVSLRASRALMANGDLKGAQDLRTGARQEQVADLQLSQAQLAAERDKGLREVGKLILSGGWASVPTVYDKYRDGAKATVKEDGKGGATITYAGADGQPLGAKTYKALPEFFADVAGGFDPAKWFDYQNNKADKDRIQGNWEKDYQLRKDAEARRATHDARMLTAAERTARAAEAKANGTEVPATAESTFDRKTASEIAKDTVKKEAEAAAAGGTPMSGVAMAKRVDEIVGAAFQQHSQRFNTSVIARDLQSVRGNPEAYAAAYNKVVSSQTMTPQELRTMGFMPPGVQGGQPQTPTGRAMQAVENVPGGGTLQNGKWVPQGQTAPAAATPAQAGQGNPLGENGPFMDFLRDNITSSHGKQFIAMKAKKELPVLQARISNITNLLKLPTVKGAIKSKLEADLAESSREAETMTTFLAGNPEL